jgi:hypothetical protein
MFVFPPDPLSSGMPGDWAPLAHDLHREITLGDPVQVGAYPSRQPFRFEPLRGEIDQVTSAPAEVTNLSQDLTKSE